MPIYEYLCAQCAHTLDALQKLSEEPLVFCPQCGAAALKRQMSAPSFRLKGGGWYETDFKNDKRRNIAEADSKSADKAEAKGDGKAEKSDKPDKSDKSDKSDKTGKTGKADKSDKPASADKPATEAKKPDPAPTRGKPDPGKAGGVA
jgi:putative FmdB family regulatory protein